MHLMIIDGNSIVNRAFFGVRALNNSRGIPTNALYGFLNIFLKLMKDDSPDAVCVAFDLKAPTFRHKMYAEYKANRSGMPEELAVQMPILKEILDAMNICRVELEGWEADDLIGTIAARAAEQGWQSTVVTGDKDSLQLVEKNISVKHIKTKGAQNITTVYDTAAFVEEYGFTPEKLVDLKALMGDSSDNYPGVAGIGEKTAMQLVQSYGTVKEIYENLDNLDIKSGVKAKLTADKEMAFLCYDLAMISRSAPCEVQLEDMTVKAYDSEKLLDVLTRLEFKKLIEKFDLSAAAQKTVPETQTRDFTETSVRSAEDAQELCEKCRNASEVFVDVSYYPEILTLGIENTIYYLEEPEKYPEVCDAVFSNQTNKTAHDVKSCIRVLKENGISSENWNFDTKIAAYLLSPTAGRYELSDLAGSYCGMMFADENEQLDLFSGANEKNGTANNIRALAVLKPIFEEKLKQDNLLPLFENIEMKLCPVLADMELAGFAVDRQALDSFGKTLTADAAVIEEQIYAEAGHSFNINSPKQLGKVLFEEMGLPTLSKKISTSAEILEKLQFTYPIAGKILDYRKLTKLNSTYVNGLIPQIDADGRIRTNFQMTVTATGRLSSTNPNLQNIPVRTELGGQIRKMFTAEEGNILVDADYSQIELRILAHMADDRLMREAFLNHEDIHTSTASHVFGVPQSEVTKEMRSRAKAVNFGIVYGISAFSLSEDIGVSVQMAKKYMEDYFKKFSGIEQYMKDVVASAEKIGYVETLYHRRRYLPELKSRNHNDRAFGQRVAMNMPIQGTAADIMKIAMINVHKALRESGLNAKLLLQIHDELIIECAEADAEAVQNILKREMENAVTLSVPLTVETNCGKTWYDAK